MNTGKLGVGVTTPVPFAGGVSVIEEGRGYGGVSVVITVVSVGIGRSSPQGVVGSLGVTMIEPVKIGTSVG